MKTFAFAVFVVLVLASLVVFFFSIENQLINPNPNKYYNKYETLGYEPDKVYELANNQRLIVVANENAKRAINELAETKKKIISISGIGLHSHGADSFFIIVYEN